MTTEKMFRRKFFHQTEAASLACRVRLKASLVITLFLSAAGCTLEPVDSLIEAARSRDADSVKRFLEGGADPDMRQTDGATALHWAVRRQDFEMATVLLEAGAEVRAMNNRGAVPLHLAAERGDTGMIKLLLESGTNPDILRGISETPIMIASQSGSAESVRILLEAGADVNKATYLGGQTALLWASALGHVDVARELIAADAGLEARSTSDHRFVIADESNGCRMDQYIIDQLWGFSPLILAVINGHIGIVELLLEAGADIDGPAANRASSLLFAAHDGHFEIVRLLLDHGADPDPIGAACSALHAAVLSDDPEILSMLLESGADINSLNYEGRTPLDLSVDLLGRGMPNEATAPTDGDTTISDMLEEFGGLRATQLEAACG